MASRPRAVRPPDEAVAARTVRPPDEAVTGWPALLAEPWPRGEGAFPLPAYSDFMPAPLVRKPDGAVDPDVRVDGDDHGWRIPARDELHELAPGLAELAAVLAPRLDGLHDGHAGHRGFSRDLVDGNPYVPPASLRRLGPLVAVVPVALSRTQDDKGRVRWTLLGGSDLGPAFAFWAGFRRGPARTDEDNDAACAARLATLVSPLLDREAQRTLGTRPRVAALHAAGVRILPIGADPDFPSWSDEPIPRALRRLVLDERRLGGRGLAGVRAVITFRAFARLPAALRRAVERNQISLAPSPESLVFYGHRGYRRLAHALPGAMQLPLLRAVPEHLRGLRVPQSGWIDQAHSIAPHVASAAHDRSHDRPATHGALRDRVRRPHRWQRVRRDADDHAALDYDDAVADALFSTDPVRLGLYDKPMARNAQLWTEDYALLLDGPTASRAQLASAARAIAAGGRFGYRFAWPAMRVGARPVVWHRPLCFTFHAGAVPAVPPRLVAASAGVITAGAPSDPIRLWPRADDRAPWLAIERAFPTSTEARLDARKLLDAHTRLGAPLAPSFATRAVSAARDASWSAWLSTLAPRATDATAAAAVTRALTAAVARTEPRPRAPLTFTTTATRDFERAYWDAIADLSTGTWRTKNNADHSLRDRAPDHADRPPPSAAPSVRDLDALADELARRHQAAIDRHGLRGHAVVGHHRFRWETDFDYPWSDGWARNQLFGPCERNVVCVIPGRDRTRAVVLADHYDTAYMEDVYEGRLGPTAGTRTAAAGADDNCSATAALLLAADVFLSLATADRLACDVWLVHLTGEEFPGDCLGARALVRALVERTLTLDDATTGAPISLHDVTLSAAIVMDMIAHRDARAADRFQIAPGDGPAAMHVARTVHEATLRWNTHAAQLNTTSPRATAAPFRRRPTGRRVPDLFPHATLIGELRPHWHWSSTVFNTDAQPFSDAGLPIVLLMEHYDIDRAGYHDTLDTLANIDLDYGAALAAIAIESAAALATT